MSDKENTLENKYREIQTHLASGWNTFNTNSVLSHVLLPFGFNVQIGIKNTIITGNQYLKDAYISSKEARPESITPGYHTYDGSYTELTLSFEGTRLRVETATINDDIVILVSPEDLPWKKPHLVLEAGMLWNREGQVWREKQQLRAKFSGKNLSIKTTAKVIEDFLPLNNPYLSVELNESIGFYSGKDMNIAEIKAIIRKNRANHEKVIASYENHSHTYDALQSAIAWNIIYDPFNGRVVFPVSRMWNTFFGGPYVLFNWDTYLGAYMASLDNKYLAYANAIEITKQITSEGFVPNYSGGYGLGSPDRSQPPVGSFVFRELYKRFKEKWILEFVFDDLLIWNRWWVETRVTNGFLCWGSNPLPEPNNGDCNNWQAAAYETGLDNSPMYDDVPFNTETHKMELADVGLMGLYIRDCDCLAEIAQVIQRNEEARELINRAEFFKTKLQHLWHEEKGIYLNKRVDTKTFSNRLSPTLFYSLLSKSPSQYQASRMVGEHFMNTKEFMGDWIIPSISRDDMAFEDQDYWRGRIWGPMNFLVYLGLKNYHLPEATTVLVEKSHDLLMKTWKKSRLIHENYNAISGNGLDSHERINLSDSFYHWGALLGFMTLIEAGYLENPSKRIEPQFASEPV